MLTKQWDTKTLGMTKVYKKDNRLLETETERHIPFHQTSQPPNTVSTISTKIWKVLQTRHATVESKLAMTKQLIKKIDKLQKNWDRQPTKHCEKRHNLRSLTYQNTTLPNSRYYY